MKFKHKNKMGVIALLMGFSILCLGTYAKFVSQDNKINSFAMGDVDIEVNEDFNPPENWDGSKYKKEVKIQNNK